MYIPCHWAFSQWPFSHHKAGRAVWTSDDSNAHTGWTGLRSSDFRTSILMLPAPCCLQAQVQVWDLHAPGLLDLPAYLSPSLHPNSQPDSTLAMFFQTSVSCTDILLYSLSLCPVSSSPSFLMTQSNVAFTLNFLYNIPPLTSQLNGIFPSWHPRHTSVLVLYHNTSHRIS